MPVRTQNPRYKHLTTSNVNTKEVYTEETGALIPLTMCHFNNKLSGMTNDQTVNFLQTYSFKKGLKQFGDCSKISAHKEMKQLHDRAVFEHTQPEDMTQLEKKESLGKSHISGRKARWKIQGPNLCKKKHTVRINHARRRSKSNGSNRSYFHHRSD